MATAWLMLAAGENRQHGGNDGYSDEPERHYLWDDTVPRHAEPKRDDIIVLWDTKTLLGASVIDEIIDGSARKELRTCPSCKKASIKERTTKLPRWRCFSCNAEFAAPVSRPVGVHTFRAEYEPRWVWLEGRLSGSELRAMCLRPESQHSIRELHWDAFVDALSASDAAAVRQFVVTAERPPIQGGFKTRNGTVRLRLGQRQFRGQLLEQFGAVCAFTGQQPEAALDAAHLYSYARVGEHHEHGGLLLRKDVHRLFDLGHLTVHPTALTIDVHSSISSYADYARLRGEKLKVSLNESALRWIRQHWAAHRGEL